MPPRSGTAAGRTIVAAVAASTLAVGLLLAPPAPDSFDSKIMYSVTVNVVEHGSLKISGNNPGSGKEYSFYGPAMTALMIPPYLAAKAIHRDPAQIAMVVNAFLLSLLAAALLVLCRLRRAEWPVALLVTALVVAGTPLLWLASTGFSELGTALGVAAALIGVEVARKGRRSGVALAGAACGFAALTRTDSLVLIAPIILVALWLSTPREARRMIAAGFAVGIAPSVVVVAAYNALRYGAPWRDGYMGGGLFNHSIPVGLAGLILSPGRGLIIYCPIVLVAGAGLVWMWRHGERTPAVAAVALLLVRVGFYSHWFAWYGGDGFGPRFLLPAMPTLALPLVVVFQRWRAVPRVARAAAALVSTVSVLIEVPGALVNYNLGRLAVDISNANPGVGQDQTLAGERRVDRVLFSWHHFPPLDQLRLLSHTADLSGHELGPRILWAHAVPLAVVALGGLAVAAIAAARSRRTGDALA